MLQVSILYSYSLEGTYYTGIRDRIIDSKYYVFRRLANALKEPTAVNRKLRNIGEIKAVCIAEALKQARKIIANSFLVAMPAVRLEKLAKNYSVYNKEATKTKR